MLAALGADVSKAGGAGPPENVERIGARHVSGKPVNGPKTKPKPTPTHHATVHAAQPSQTHQFTFPN
jgi:hypothetical protein